MSSPRGLTRRGRIMAAAWVVTAGAVMLSCLPAAADQIDPVPSPGGGSTGTQVTGSGYAVQVTLSGNAAPAGRAARRVSVQPACWWAPAPTEYQDAKAMLKWYDSSANDPLAWYNDGPGATLAQLYGSRDAWEQAAAQEKAGVDLSWYRATCRDPADYPAFMGRAPGVIYQGLYRALPAAAPVPPPLVKPADLALVARDAMVIPVPATDRNPKIGAPGNSTLVGLPTWFWVTNAAAVGGRAGTRTIRAQAGDVWAEVTATTGGLQLTSPAGSTRCAPGRAITRYADGVPQSAACTVEFSRASIGYPRGYPVTASTGWQATWAGSGGTGGALDPLDRTITVNVPVAEVQNVVSGSG